MDMLHQIIKQILKNGMGLLGLNKIIWVLLEVYIVALEALVVKQQV